MTTWAYKSMTNGLWYSCDAKAAAEASTIGVPVKLTSHAAQLDGECEYCGEPASYRDRSGKWWCMRFGCSRSAELRAARVKQVVDKTRKKKQEIAQ